MTTPTETTPRLGPWPVLRVFALMAGAILLTTWLETPSTPELLEGDGVFSLARAQEHVAAVAREPHPLGSVAKAAVRDYLVTTLRGWGLEVEVQRQWIASRYRRGGGDARYALVENVVGRLPGQAASPGKALVLMAHYDSVPSGPGAADDASGVATVLETTRLLVALEQRRNDVIVLLTDGEEMGLFGAQAYFADQERVAEVGLVLNFEARGSRGPVSLFETSPQNGELIAAFDQAVHRPMGNSLAQTVYQYMPNDTDLSIAKAAGLSGMNFAFVDGFFDYHAATDTPSRLSPATLSQMGHYAWSLARHFVDRPLPPPAVPDRHFFNPLPGFFVHYPPWVDVGLLLLAFVWWWFLERKTGLEGDGRSILKAGLAVLAAVLLPLLVLMGLFWLRIPRDLVTDFWHLAALQGPYFAVWVACGVGLSVGLLGLCQHGLGSWWTGSSPRHLSAAGIAVWLLMAGIAAGFFPGALPMLVWPILWILALQQWRGQAEPSWPLLLLSLPVLMLIGGLARTVDLGLGASLPAIGVLPMLGLVLLLLPWLLQGDGRRLGLGLAPAAVVGLVTLDRWQAFDAELPEPTELFLLQDGDRGENYWATTDQRLEAWHHQRIGENPPFLDDVGFLPTAKLGTRGRPVESAGTLGALPEVEILQSAVNAEGRRLRLRLRVEEGSDYLNLFVPESAGLVAWRVEGQELIVRPPSGGYWRLRGYGLPSAGAVVELDLAPGVGWPKIRLTSVNYRLPAGHSLPPRSPSQMRRPYSYADATVATRSFELETLVTPAQSSGPTSGQTAQVP